MAPSQTITIHLARAEAPFAALAPAPIVGQALSRSDSRHENGGSVPADATGSGESPLSSPPPMLSFGGSVAGIPPSASISRLPDATSSATQPGPSVPTSAMATSPSTPTAGTPTATTSTTSLATLAAGTTVDPFPASPTTPRANLGLGTSSLPSTSSTDHPLKLFYKVSLEDPCYKVLPAALRKYKVSCFYCNAACQPSNFCIPRSTTIGDYTGHPDKLSSLRHAMLTLEFYYSLFIVYGQNTERCLSLDERPLLLYVIIQFIITCYASHL